MVELQPDDRATLVKLLSDRDELADAASRRETMRAAGLGQFVAKINLEGATGMVLGRILDYLGEYGRPDEAAPEALGTFLNWVKNLVGVEQQSVIGELIRKYKMTVPLADLPSVPQWQGKRDPNQIFEKIVGENTLRPIAFLARGIELSHAVVYIGLPNQSGSATGFLVAPDLLITNFHVLGDRQTAEQSIYRCNFENDWGGAALAVKEYRAAKDGLFVANDKLDFALVELTDKPGAQWGHVPLVPGKITKDDRVNIIQHPGGQAKQVSIQSNLVEYVDERVVQYVTSTMPGSSGSPAFNDRWELVALHHAGGSLAEPASGARHYRNEGVLISAIVQALEPDVRKRVTGR